MYSIVLYNDCYITLDYTFYISTLTIPIHLRMIQESKNHFYVSFIN